MKLKATCSGLSDALVTALNGLRPTVLKEVIGPHLHRPNLGSAGFYVQLCDLADRNTHGPFCEVRLSGVSLTDDRAYQDLLDARSRLEIVYRQVIQSHLKPGQKVDLFVVLMLDGPPKLGVSPLIEGPIVEVEGR